MHIANCHCGEVEIVCSAEPHPVVLCHCSLCQRRTGSLLSIAAWFEKRFVQISGETRQYTRTSGDAGLEFTFNFCVNCGTTIWWLPARPEGQLRGRIAIAGGCFSEADFPVPTLSIYERHKSYWLELPAGLEHYQYGI